jgi:hypothetical protein
MVPYLKDAKRRRCRLFKKRGNKEKLVHNGRVYELSYLFKNVQLNEIQSGLEILCTGLKFSEEISQDESGIMAAMSLMCPATLNLHP